MFSFQVQLSRRLTNPVVHPSRWLVTNLNIGNWDSVVLKAVSRRGAPLTRTVYHECCVYATMSTDQPYRFSQSGDEPLDQKPICVRFPQSIAERLRAMPDRSDFIRRAVAAMLA